MGAVGPRPTMSVYPPVFDGRVPMAYYYPTPYPVPQFFPHFAYSYPQVPYQLPPVPMAPYHLPPTFNNQRINESFQKKDAQQLKTDTCDSETTQQPTPSSRKSSDRDVSQEESQRSVKVAEPKAKDVTTFNVIGKRSEPPRQSHPLAKQDPDEDDELSEDSLESQIRKIRNFWKGSNYSYPHILKRVKIVRHKLTDEVEVCEVLDFSGKGLYTNNHCEEKFFAAI
jgi:hypothetical protein